MHEHRDFTMQKVKESASFFKHHSVLLLLHTLMLTARARSRAACSSRPKCQAWK